MTGLARSILLIVGLVWPVLTNAHEMRPAFLSMTETSANAFDVFWKIPAKGDQRLGLYAVLPETCSAVDEPVQAIDGGAYTERWSVLCANGLQGGIIRIDGLQATMTDTLLRIEYATGATEIGRLTPERPEMAIAGLQGSLQVAGTYFVLGVDHILNGVDHLVFVLALILLIRDRWMLVKTITAFTVAHSITLAGASLGLIGLPQAPVEAVIALSIAFVARELTLDQPGEARLSARMPWVVAFAFGLLHGFGFAGALQETGLPQTDVPLALVTFNLGVEAGQLFFVGQMLVLSILLRRTSESRMALLRSLVAYAIGTVSMVWLVLRISGVAMAG